MMRVGLMRGGGGDGEEVTRAASRRTGACARRARLSGRDAGAPRPLGVAVDDVRSDATRGISAHALHGCSEMNAGRSRRVTMLLAALSALPLFACGAARAPTAAEPSATPTPSAPRSDRVETETVPPDTRIARAVERELEVDAGVDARAISVDVDDGVVELRGRVRSLAIADAAIERAEMVDGVKAVVDRIEVAPGDRSDAEIRDDVHRALRVDPATRFGQPTVNVLDGVATLRGHVDSFARKRLAEQAARSVRGVRDVVNQLEVRYAGKRADAEILEDVRGALRADRWVDEWLLEAEVDGGVVTLRGVQPTASAKRRAIDDAWVVGVRDVDARLRDVHPALASDLRRPPPDYRYPDDTVIQGYIRAWIARDPRLNTRAVHVNVAQGIVTLEGSVGSLAARTAAPETANTVRGVWRVDNRLLVEERRVDARLEREARQALARATGVDEHAITVDVSAGVATLRGAAESRFARSAAESAVERVPGIRELHDEIELSPRSAEPLDDATLQQNVIAHLASHPYVAPEQIEVLVSHGSVMLRGDVDDWRAEQEAVRAAYEAGATEVLDQISVAHPSP